MTADIHKFTNNTYHMWFNEIVTLTGILNIQ